MRIAIRRTENFARNLAAADGGDHPATLWVDVQPSDLSDTARRLLAGIAYPPGQWTYDLDQIGYDRDHRAQWGYKGWGAEQIEADIAHPTAADVSRAVVEAFARIVARRLEEEANAARLQAAKDRVTQAEAELAAAKAALEEAR